MPSCQIAGCERPHYGRSFCRSHYDQQRQGRPVGRVRKIMRNVTPADRFFTRVQRTDGCWIWIGALKPNGYGHFTPNPRDRTKEYAHRFAFQIMYGEIPDGMFVCHRCDNPRCVNPAHLFLGTHQDNMNDMIAKGRGCKGSDVPRSKLTESDVVDIRSLSSFGARVRDLAMQFDVSPSNIGMVVTRRTWRHVP